MATKNGGTASVLHRSFTHKLLTTLLAILMVYAIVWVGSEIRNNIREFTRIGRAEAPISAITVDGVGKVTAAPTTGTITVGLTTEGTDVAATQAKNTEKMNRIIAAVKELGIADADIQTTNYSINPSYDYRAGAAPRITGYSVDQTVSVKLHDLTKANAVLAKAGELGANRVSGPDFSIDDREAMKAQARAKAIAQAKEKMAVLARDLGVRPVRILSFNESEGGFPPPIYYGREASLSVGGPEPVPPPKIETGTLDVSVGVSITFEIE